MKPSTRNRAKGMLHQVKGQIKEEAGKLSGNRELEAKGTVEKVAGKIQEKVGDVEKRVGK